MKKLTLLSTGILSFASLLFVTSCGNNIEQDIEFEEYSNSVTGNEFFEKIDELDKTLYQYTLNSTSYSEHTKNINDVHEIDKTLKKQETKFNNDLKVYSIKRTNNYYGETTSSNYEESSEKDYTQIVKGDYLYEYDHLNKTYTKNEAGYAYFDYEATIEPYELLEDLEFTYGFSSLYESNKKSQYFIDDNQYTVIITSNYEYEESIDSTATATVENTVNYVFQFKADENEIVVRTKAEFTQKYKYLYNIEVTYEDYQLQVKENIYNLNAPTFDDVDDSEYYAIDYSSMK